MRRFVDWISSYTLSAPGMVARMLLRAPAAFDPEPWTEGLQRTERLPDRMTAARARVLEAADDGLAWTRSGLAHAAGVSSAVIDGLRDQGVFETVMIPPRPVVAAPDPGLRAAGAFAATRRPRPRCCAPPSPRAAHGVTLLDGVTGSGKTEVYFEAVAAALDKGRQVLILLPEIALTHAFLERFQDRFGAKPAEWHSDLPPRMRERVWRQVAEGSVRVVAGARSALFLPFQRARADRRRRGARPRLQAGGRRLLQRPRHGGGARPHRRLSGRAGLGDAFDRKPGQCRARAATPAQCCRRVSPRPRCPTSRRSTCAARRPPAAVSCRRCC